MHLLLHEERFLPSALAPESPVSVPKLSATCLLSPEAAKPESDRFVHKVYQCLEKSLHHCRQLVQDHQTRSGMSWEIIYMLLD